MPNLPAGRTAPGREILSVLRCVIDVEESPAAVAAVSVSSPSAGAASVSVAGPLAMESGRLMRIVFIGAASFWTGATPSASESEIRAVLDFDACFWASERSWSAMMPVLRRIACWGISCVTPLSFCVTDFSCSSALPDAADGEADASAAGAAGAEAAGAAAGAGAGSFSPGPIAGFAAPATPTTGLRMTGFSFSVVERAFAIGAAGGGSDPDTGLFVSSTAIPQPPTNATK